MNGPSPSRITFVAPAIVCLAVSVVMGLQVSRQMREDLYWTPADEASSLAAARSRAEVIVDGELLQDLASADRLAVDGRPVAPDGVRIRFNNVNAVTRAQMIIFAAASGSGIAFLIGALLLPGNRRQRKSGASAPDGSQ